jgi:hypothetical protein
LSEEIQQLENCLYFLFDRIEKQSNIVSIKNCSQAAMLLGELGEQAILLSLDQDPVQRF